MVWQILPFEKIMICWHFLEITVGFHFILFCGRFQKRLEMIEENDGAQKDLQLLSKMWGRSTSKVDPTPLIISLENNGICCIWGPLGNSRNSWKESASHHFPGPKFQNFGTLWILVRIASDFACWRISACLTTFLLITHAHGLTIFDFWINYDFSGKQYKLGPILTVVPWENIMD